MIKLVLVLALSLNLTTMGEVRIANASWQIASESQQNNNSVIVEIKRSVREDLPFLKEAPINFDEIVIVDDYAMTLWISGHMAGLTFSQKTDTGWQAIGGASGVPDRQYMESIGIPPEVARQFHNHLWKSSN